MRDRCPVTGILRPGEADDGNRFTPHLDVRGIQEERGVPESTDPESRLDAHWHTATDDRD